jgi:hypothetical protein
MPGKGLVDAAAGHHVAAEHDDDLFASAHCFFVSAHCRGLPQREVAGMRPAIVSP